MFGLAGTANCQTQRFSIMGSCFRHGPKITEDPPPTRAEVDDPQGYVDRNPNSCPPFVRSPQFHQIEDLSQETLTIDTNVQLSIVPEGRRILAGWQAGPTSAAPGEVGPILFCAQKGRRKNGSTAQYPGAFRTGQTSYRRRRPKAERRRPNGKSSPSPSHSAKSLLNAAACTWNITD